MDTDQDHLRDVNDLTNGVDDLCPVCRAKRDLPDLTRLTDEQLQTLYDRAEGLLEVRSQESMMASLDDDDCADELPTVDTTDGLFSDFTEFVAEHSGLRFFQALTIFSGYKKLYGEDKDGELTDLFYQKRSEGVAPMTRLLHLLAEVGRIALSVLFTLFLLALLMAFLALPFAALFRLIAG